MSSELDDFIRRREQQEQGTTRVLVEAATGTSPEQAARAAGYRRKYGLPAPYEPLPQLETNEHVEEALAAVQRDPTVAKWLARDRGNAALGRGGMANLADTSEAIGAAAPAREKSWLESAKSLLLNSTSTTLPGLVIRGARAVGTARAAAEDLTPGNIGRALGAGAAGAASGFAGTVEAGAELAERYSPSAIAARELFGVDTGTGWVGDLARQRRQGWEKLANETRPEAKTEEGKGVLSGIESMPLSIGALVTGAFSGGATTAAALMGAAVGGQSYGRARDYGLSVEQSALYGAIDAGIELGTERLTFLKALDVGTPFAKRFAQTLFTENVGEQFATLGQDFNEWANISSNEGKTFGDFLNERPDAAYQTAIAATLMAGTLTPTVSAIEYGMNRVGRTLARTAYTEDTKRFAQSLADLTKASVVLQRDRGSFEEFVRDAAEGTEATTVYVEAEQLQNVLNQSGLTVDDAFDMTGMTPEQLAEAVERGEDVAIPVEEYAARIASTPVGEKLIDHLRLDPDDMSAEQAKVYLQSVKEELATASEQAAVEGEARSGRQASRAAVEGKVLADLQTARRFTDDVNETYASLVGAFFETQSAKLGMTAEEMFKQYPLRVQSGEVAQPTYDQPQDNPVVNIGLAASEAMGGQPLDPQQVRDALAAIGVNITGENIAQSDTEQTFIGQLDRALTPEEATALSEQLGQEAIAQFAGGAGGLYGPMAANWGEFNPEFFLGMDGQRLAQNDTRPVVYHRMRQGDAFDRFDVSKGELGIHFGSEQTVSGLGDTRQPARAYRLDIRNPLRLIDTGSFRAGDIWGQLADRGIIEEADGGWETITDEEARSAIKDAGYDGVVYLNRFEDSEEDPGTDLTDEQYRAAVNPAATDSFIIFDPDQVEEIADETFNQSAAPLQTLPMGVQGTGPGGRVRNWDVGEAFTLRHMAKYGRALDPTDPEDYQIALQSLLEDYENQKAQPDNGEAWYSDDIAEALEITKLILPEIEDPVRRDIFLTAVALLSPQQGPIDNWGNAIVAMTGYSIEGRFALRHPDGMEFGVKSHSTGLALFEHLINEYGEIGALVWLNSEHTGAEMEAVRRASGLFLNKADNYLPAETNKTESKLGVYMFGPKVGDFMLNSAGLDQSAVTVDLWMARTYNRVIGRLTDVNEKRAAEGGLADQMRGKAERNVVKQLVRDAAAQAGIAPSAMQAALWYFEQRLYRNHGIQSESTSFSDAAREAALRRGIPLDGPEAQGRAAGSAGATAADLAEGVRVYDQSGLNPQTAFARESFEPTIATRHADGTVYADLFVSNEERQARVAEALGATAVVRVAKDDPRLEQGVPLWFTRPPLNADGTITIQHFGPGGLTQTDPSLWGQSNSLPKTERAAIGTSLPRTYFGIASGQPGGYKIEFPGRNQYEARVPAERLYDIASDPDGLKQGDGVNALERRIAAAGYTGYWSNNKQLGLVATVFEPVAVQPAKTQVFHQDAVFFSALERTLEKTATNKASAQQWKATLEKTPGIKAEELEWTGLLEFLDMQEGPITREQLLEVVRGAGLRVDEVLLGQTSQELLDLYGVEEGDDDYDLIMADTDTYGSAATKFQSWSSDPGNDTYRELLITLPIGTGRNPNRAPSTHWDTDGVIAHARFMDKVDADGKRVLFIEEVQSDWHQKGRDQGYENAPSPEVLNKLAVLTQDVQDIEEALDEITGDIVTAEQAVVTEAEVFLREGFAAFEQQADDQIAAGALTPEVAERAKASVRDSLGIAFYDARSDDETIDLRDAISFAERLTGSDAPPALQEWRDRHRRLLSERSDVERRLSLVRNERAQLEFATRNGIPNAPFRTDWPALVMKRMIRWAAEHGYERIAWTTGTQQEVRYWGELQPAQRAFQEATEPYRVREELLKVLGPELTAVLPLEVVDAPMLGALENDQVRQAVVEAISVDVVDVLAANGFDAEQLTRLPDMVGEALPVDSRTSVARGFADALQFVGARLRTALNTVDTAGGDRELFSTIRASDLDPRVVVGLLTTRSPGAGASDAGAGAAASGAEAGRLAGVGSENRSAELAATLNWHGRAVAERTGNRQVIYDVPPGEGMRAFYDRNLVNITNKLVKKYGARVGAVQVVDARSENAAADDPAVMAANLEVNAISARTGIFSAQSTTALEARDAAMDAARRGMQPGFDITPELADAAMGGFPLFQRERAPRGQIAFGPDITRDPSVITLLRGADLSTFVHELGHFFFEVTNHMANQAGAPAQIIADRDAMLRYLGVESATEWANRTPAQRREGHERMARSFEAFLFEGKAPSLELRSLFGRLRSWMVSVYRTITRLDVELTDEVRGAFTRMLASDEAIAEAEADAELRPQFAAKPEGMSDRDWEEYQQLNADARDEAAIQLESRSLRDMRHDSKAASKEIKRLQREDRERREIVREEVRAELSERPVYRASRFLRTGEINGEKVEGEHRIDTEAARAELLRTTGDDAIPNEFALMTKKGGVPPQLVADLFGFSSVDHLFKELLLLPSFTTAVEAETDQRMRERYGDINTPEEVEQAARAAVHNEARGRVLASELAALQKQPEKKRVFASAAKRMAEDMVARLRIRDIRPSTYEAAERRAAKAAFTLGADLPDQAIRHKRNQLLQFNLAKAAHAARDEMRKAREYLNKFSSGKSRANIDPDYLDQIDQLLERYELRQISNREADRRKSLTEWIEKMRAEGFEPAIDPETLAEIGRKNWRDLTVEEMRGLLDAVRNIEHLGRLTKKLLTAKDKADLDTAAAEMGEAVRANATRTVDLPVGAKTWWESVKSGAADFLAMHRKIANLAYVFDGNQYGGVFWERFIRPMNERGDWQAKRNREANEQLAELFKPIAREDTTTRRFEPAIGRSISLEDRLMVALNMGNEANLQRLMSGDRWEYEQVLAVVAPLEAHHWDFVESVWRHLDSYRPEIAAKERRVSGVEPEWVEAVPFQIEIGGELRLISGGYFPIKYDPDKNSKANADEAAEVLKQMTRGLYTSAQTRRGHTKARVDAVNNRPLKKTFGVIFGHVNQVIHDLAWHEYLIDANRLLKHGAVDSAIREHHGPEVLRWMGKALEDIAIGDIPAQNAFEKSVRHLRTGVSIAAMGWSFWTSLLQPTGLTQSMSRIGARWVLKGIGDWVGNPVKANAKLEWVREQSVFMRERGDTMQREISEIRSRIGAKSPLRGAIGKIVPEGVSSAMADSYFYLIMKAQLIADMPTWLGQYEKSMAGGEQHERAVAIADQAVIDSQGGGTTKDLAGIQRGSELMKLFTNFYSYFSATFNLMTDRTTELKRVGPRDLPYFAVDMMLLSVVPATLASLMYAALKGDDDEPEELAKQVAQDNLVYMLGLMVGVREIGSALAGVAGYTGPAGARFFSETGRFGKQVAQGEVDEPLLRAGNSMAGILFHYPATQLDRTVRGTIQYAEGDAGLQAPIVGPPAQ